MEHPSANPENPEKLPTAGVPSFFLGVDAGASQCKARLASRDKGILATAKSGPANLQSGLEVIQARILQCAGDCLADAGLQRDVFKLTNTAAGIAGNLTPSVLKSIEALGWPFRSFRATSDLDIAHLGAHLGADGAVLVLGTGSVALWTEAGQQRVFGGYGFPAADEGSGAALGLAAVGYGLRALDGREECTGFGEAVLDFLGGSLAEAAEWAARARSNDYARLAPLVLEKARKGDPKARAILEREICFVEQYLKALKEAGAKSVAMVGGLAAHIRPWISEEWTAFIDEARGDAMTGALLLAGFPAEEAALP